MFRTSEDLKSGAAACLYATPMKSSAISAEMSRVGAVMYTGPLYPILYRYGISPEWSKWAWDNITASRVEMSNSGASRYGYLSLP